MKKFLLFLLSTLALYGDDILIKESKHRVLQTIENIKENVLSKDFSVFGIIDHEANAKASGMEMQEAKVIIFGNPKAGTKLMQEDVLTALDLPLRVLVYRDASKNVQVAYRKVSELQKDFNLKDIKHLMAMDKGLEAIIIQATQ